MAARPLVASRLPPARSAGSALRGQRRAQLYFGAAVEATTSRPHSRQRRCTSRRSRRVAAAAHLAATGAAGLRRRRRRRRRRAAESAVALLSTPAVACPSPRRARASSRAKPAEHGVIPGSGRGCECARALRTSGTSARRTNATRARSAPITRGLRAENADAPRLRVAGDAVVHVSRCPDYESGGANGSDVPLRLRSHLQRGGARKFGRDLLRGLAPHLLEHRQRPRWWHGDHARRRAPSCRRPLVVIAIVGFVLNVAPPPSPPRSAAAGAR